MASKNPWLDFSINVMKLGLEAQTVIALRLVRASAGGPAAEREAALMVSEKIQAGLELQTQLMTSGLDLLGPGPSSRALAHVRRKVRANRRRLLRGD